MTKLQEIIEKQQKGHENEPRFMIGEQLKEIADREPLSEKLLERDLEIPEMSLEAAEKHFQEYADKNHKGAKTFCITPIVAERILRDFYGLPQKEESVSSGSESSAFVDLSSFF